MSSCARSDSDCREHTRRGKGGSCRPAFSRGEAIMVGSTRPFLLILTCALGLSLAGPALATADDPAPAKGTAAGPRADRQSEYALPDEDPPQVFVPLHPLTVEDRGRIQALRDYSVARALEDRHEWATAIGVLQEGLKD